MFLPQCENPWIVFPLPMRSLFHVDTFFLPCIFASFFTTFSIFYIIEHFFSLVHFRFRRRRKRNNLVFKHRAKRNRKMQVSNDFFSKSFGFSVRVFRSLFSPRSLMSLLIRMYISFTTPDYSRKISLKVKQFSLVLSQLYYFPLLFIFCCCCLVVIFISGYIHKIVCILYMSELDFFFEKMFFDFSFSFQILSVDAAFLSISRVIFLSFHYFRM